MKSKALGQSGIQASVVGLGTWAIGGWMWGDSDRKDAVKAIQAAVDAGMNLVDTAPMYGFGLSEELVGEALQGRRDKVVLATKCGLIWHKQQGDFFFKTDDKHPKAEGAITVSKCLAPAIIRYEVELSLRRLKTDCIDLYQTHWQDSTTPIADTMAELLKLKQEGKIRSIGCSNATPAQMDAYRAVGPLDVDQELYSMLDRNLEATNLSYCARHKVAFLAYSPLARGLLTGKIDAQRKFDEGDQRNQMARFSVENRQKVLNLCAAVKPIADDHRISLGQLAIAWALAQPGCTHTLVGVRTAAQVAENAKAAAVKLSDGEVNTINSAIAQHAAGIP